MTSESAPLIVQSLAVIAGSFLLIGALLAAVATAWRRDRHLDRLDIDSTERYDRARRSLAHIHRHPGPRARHRRRAAGRLLR